jgi:hypothetical protein
MQKRYIILDSEEKHYTGLSRVRKPLFSYDDDPIVFENEVQAEEIIDQVYQYDHLENKELRIEPIYF